MSHHHHRKNARIGHAIELFVLLVMVLYCAGIWWVLSLDKPPYPRHQQSEVIIAQPIEPESRAESPVEQQEERQAEIKREEHEELWVAEEPPVAEVPNEPEPRPDIVDGANAAEPAVPPPDLGNYSPRHPRRHGRILHRPRPLAHQPKVLARPAKPIEQPKPEPDPTPDFPGFMREAPSAS